MRLWLRTKKIWELQFRTSKRYFVYGSLLLRSGSTFEKDLTNINLYFLYMIWWRFFLQNDYWWYMKNSYCMKSATLFFFHQIFIFYIRIRRIRRSLKITKTDSIITLFFRWIIIVFMILSDYWEMFASGLAGIDIIRNPNLLVDVKWVFQKLKFVRRALLFTWVGIQ